MRAEFQFSACFFFYVIMGLDALFSLTEPRPISLVLIHNYDNDILYLRFVDFRFRLICLA